MESYRTPLRLMSCQTKHRASQAKQGGTAVNDIVRAVLRATTNNKAVSTMYVRKRRVQGIRT